MIPTLKPDENYIEFEPVRIELVSTSDPYTRLKPGDKGYAHAWNRQIDNKHALFVNWDNGSNMGLIRGTDDWKEIPK